MCASAKSGSKVILVTGGIASGKSEVCRHLRSLGHSVYDCDSRCKALYDEIPGLRGEVERAIGVPFSQIGIIFEDPARREALEAVVYPVLKADLERWIAASSDPVVFVESAVAASKPLFDGLWDEIWLVRAPLADRLARNPKAAGRIASQVEIDPARATVVIDNDGTLRQLYETVNEIL